MQTKRELSCSTSYISLGSKGEEVKQLQNNLIKLGYGCGSCGADGDFGADTKNAVIRFQRDNSLEQDGIVGPATRDALRQALKDLAANKNEGGGTTNPATTNNDLKDNGQAEGYSGYGGIGDITNYVKVTYGKGWDENKNNMVLGVSDFLQDSLESDANNCTLASITRIMKYYSGQGYSNIPNDEKEIYKVVREIGVKHGYDPVKTGILRDMFVYTPFEIDNMVHDVWKAFNYSSGDGENSISTQFNTIKSDIDNNHPLLLNIKSGDYGNHTVSVIGYKTYYKEGEGEKLFVQIYDGYSKTERYIDWEKFGPILSNITRIIPPEANTTEIKPHVTIHSGNPVNIDSDEHGRKNILPIKPKEQMM